MIARWYSLTAVLLGIGLPLIAVAQVVPVVVCSGLAGCGQPVENTLFNNILPSLIALGIRVASGGCVIFIVISGVKMLLSAGDEGKATAARNGIFYALGGLAACLAAATLVGFVITGEYGQCTENQAACAQRDLIFGSAGLLPSVLSIILTLFNVGFVVMVMIAGVRMVLAGGSPDEFKKGGEVIKWAIVGAIVVNLARMIVAAFLNLDL